MQDNDFKEDLFGKGVSSGKTPRLPIFDGYVKQQRHLPYFKMPTEYAVIFVIGVLVLLTLSYAWGVKAGRLSVPSTEVLNVKSAGSEEVEDVGYFEDIQEAQDVDLKSYVDYVDDGDVSSEDKDDPLPEVVKVAPEKAEEQISQQTVAGAGYVIYLAALKEESRANGLSDKLRSLGVDARVAKKSDWYQVYAAGYASVSAADSAKVVLQKDYPDCYIRKIE